MNLEALLDAPKKKVETYLNEVSYGVDPNYVPSLFAIEFVNFIKLVNGSAGEENTTPVLHYRMLDTLASPEPNCANMLFRGAAKTTVFAEYLFLYLATYGELPDFGRVDLALYVSDSMDNGVKNLRKNLEYRYSESEFLKEYVPEAKFTDSRWEFINADGKRLIIKGYGAKTGVRGTKELGKRPQLAVLDDLVSDEDARSATIIAAIEDTVYKAVDHALHPTRRKTIWNGTPFNMRDPLYKAIESGAWKVNVFPVCERFPCSREEFRGAWEDRFTYDAILAAYTKAVLAGRVDAFMQELMLRIMSDEERVILDSEIRWYSRTALLKQQSAYNFYITTDFATSAKEKADYAVISVWAINSAGWWFWVDGVCEQQLMDKTLDDVFHFAQLYRPLEVGFETNGQQGGFIPLIQRKMLTDNVWFNIAKARNSKELGFRSEADKTTRFMQITPEIKAGHILFPKEMQNHPAMIEMKEELSLFTRGGFKSRHDDFADTISMLNNFDPIKPSGETISMTKTKDGYWAPDIEEEEVHTKDSYIV